MPDWMIRDAKAADLALLGPLEDRAGLRFLESAHPYCASMVHFDPARLAELASAGTVWVAVAAQGAPVGFAIAEARGREAYLHELDVEVAYGRRGVGRALIRRVAFWARSRGLEALLLSTFRDVPWNGPYYERLGFEVVPLDTYDDSMHAQRRSDAAAGMRVESRVMMRASLAQLLGVE
jgi:GNAT superfamily N-acetyltransferase